MISESEKYQEEDRKLKERIDARNEFESYLYSLKNQFLDSKSNLKSKMSNEDKITLENAIREKIDWLDLNQTAEAEEYKAQKQELEDTVNPIVTKIYGGSSSGGHANDESGEL
jgi:molecular chaperone DnaK (HSP70)